MVLPLLQLKEFDQYTTTHAINVSVLTMALGDFSAWGRNGTRALGFGAAARPGEDQDPGGDPEQAGEAHRRGRAVVECHPPRCCMILEGEEPLDLAAAVVRAPPPRRRAAATPLTIPGRADHAAGWCTCATFTTRCAPSAPIATRGPGPGARLHRQAGRGRVRSRRGRAVRGDDAAVGQEDRTSGREAASGVPPLFEQVPYDQLTVAPGVLDEQAVGVIPAGDHSRQVHA